MATGSGAVADKLSVPAASISEVFLTSGPLHPFSLWPPCDLARVARKGGGRRGGAAYFSASTCWLSRFARRLQTSSSAGLLFFSSAASALFPPLFLPQLTGWRLLFFFVTLPVSLIDRRRWRLSPHLELSNTANAAMCFEEPTATSKSSLINLKSFSPQFESP